MVVNINVIYFQMYYDYSSISHFHMRTATTTTTTTTITTRVDFCGRYDIVFTSKVILTSGKTLPTAR